MVIYLKKIAIFSLILFIIDQIVKLIVSFNVELNSSICVIKNFFYISHVHNFGAAFSIFYGGRIFLILISIIALVCLYNFLLKNKEFRNLEIVSYSMLIGGILGNLFDRIFYGYVIDYLDFYIFNYNYPVFNIADMCIVISVCLLIIDMFRGGKNESNSWWGWF